MRDFALAVPFVAMAEALVERFPKSVLLYEYTEAEHRLEVQTVDLAA